jgi:hypothetical protein
LICSTPSHVGRNVRTCILAVSCVSVHKYILGVYLLVEFHNPLSFPIHNLVLKSPSFFYLAVFFIFFMLLYIFVPQ